MIAVPVYRVHQIPLVGPGFEPAAFLSSVTQPALETGDMYRRAETLRVSSTVQGTDEEIKGKRIGFVTTAREEWLASNGKGSIW